MEPEANETAIMRRENVTIYPNTNRSPFCYTAESYSHVAYFERNTTQPIICSDSTMGEAGTGGSE